MWLLLLAVAAAGGPQHWVDRSNGLPREPVTAVAIDPDDDRVVYAGVDGYLFRSGDGGKSFSPVLSYTAGPAGDDADLSTADTDGAADDETTTVRAPSPDTIPLDPNADDGFTLNEDDLPDGSLDTGTTRQTTVEEEEGGDAVSPARLEPGVRTITFVPSAGGLGSGPRPWLFVIVATPRGLYRSYDDARSFDRLAIPGGTAANDVRDVIVDPSRPSRWFVATAAGLFVSTDGGATFDRAVGRVGTTSILCLAADAGGTLLVGSERGLLRSRDGGATFSDLLLRGESAFPAIHAVAIADAGGTLYAGVATGLYVATRNSAILEHYEGMPGDAPTAISPDPQERGGLVLATRSSSNGGAFASSDIGLTSAQIEPVPAQQVLALARESKDSARVWAATNNGLFRLEPGTGIRVSQDELAAVRERFAKEPPLDELVERALVFQGADIDIAGATARAGWAALAPAMELGYQFDYGDTTQARTSFIFGNQTGAPPTGDPLIDLQNNFDGGLAVLTPSQQLTHQFWINLTWDLDRVILTPGAATLGRNSGIAVQNRIHIADAVRSFYVARRRLITQVALEEKKAKTAAQQLQRIHKELQILELEAQLARLVGEDLFDSEQP